MQGLKFLIGLTFFQILAACSNSDQAPPIQLLLHSKNECEIVFKSENYSVVENFCGTEQKPILIKFADQEIRSDWIDEKTSRFLFQEGCTEVFQCFYELSTNDSIVRGRFSYRINLTEGEYTFEVEPNGQSKLLSESSSDIAS